jgi:hypothetical protein
MLNSLKKVMFSFVLLVVVATTGAWQNSNTVLAAEGTPETPLAPGLTWNDLGESVRSIQLDIQGNTLELSGQTFVSTEKFADGIPHEVSDFYSNVELYKSGWSSEDAFEAPDGVHRIFYHEAGYYLAIDYVKCQDDANLTCVTVWKSAQKDTAKFIAGTKPIPADPGPTATFAKKTPADGSTGINPASTFLSWNTFSGAQKYSYCVKEGSECASNDPNWTGTNLNTSITLSDLNPNKIYYWQVKAITCLSCIPKKYTLADGGTWWKFTTTTGSIRISGNVGVSGGTLSWFDGSSKSTTANSSGDYSFTVTYNWSGEVTPSKSGYVFVPVKRTYLNLTTNQTIQNYAALSVFTISGNAGVAGAVLSYTDGVAKTAIADANGNYNLSVSPGWSGTITPSKTGYTFTPKNRTYSLVLSNLTGQNYVAALIRFTISGNAGVAGASMYYFDGTLKSVLSNYAGNYVISVPYNWTGNVRPAKAGIAYFTPAFRSYTNLKSHMTNQNYRANHLAAFGSIAADDGYILETTETSGVGGGFNALGSVFVVGDNSQNRQYRSILSFNTINLPDTAVILSATLKLKRQAVAGIDPMSTHGYLVLDIKKPYFGAASALGSDDFGAAAGLSSGGWMGKTPVGDIYTGVLAPQAFPFINKTGLTQLRLRFQIDDNNNNIADYIGFYSGNAITASYRPVLQIVYYVP